jgi:Flp pilus assembly protein TadG
VASVEFAIIAPVLVAVVMGVSEVSTMFDVQNELAVAAREGARLASMDRTGMLDGSQTTNEKIATDIKNFLTSNGLKGDQALVYIVHAKNRSAVFDLDNPDNDLQLFELRVELPYAAVSGLGDSSRGDLKMSAKVIFRNARAIVAK